MFGFQTASSDSHLCYYLASLAYFAQDSRLRNSVVPTGLNPFLAPLYPSLKRWAMNWVVPTGLNPFFGASVPTVETVGYELGRPYGTCRTCRTSRSVNLCTLWHPALALTFAFIRVHSRFNIFGCGSAALCCYLINLALCAQNLDSQWDVWDI